MALLTAADDGSVIVSHSMLKTFRRCPKKAEYKYERGLKPKTVSRPLKRGKWMHALLEAYYKGEDWEELHRSMSYQFSQLFDEEKDLYGDLPRDCERMMRSYLWHYKLEEWEVQDVEFTVETDLPSGIRYRGKVDMMVEDPYGLWLVDHKTHKTLPGHDYRLLDAQSVLYLWAAREMGFDVQGFIFNYIRAKPPTEPELIKDGSRISRWKSIDTDFPTAARFLLESDLDIEPYKQKLRVLKSERYEPGKMQTSSRYQRAVIEKSDEMIERVVAENDHTARRMVEYYEEVPPDERERVVDRSCMYMCSYNDICPIELYGGNTTAVMNNYDQDDNPLSYQEDNKEDNLNG